MSRGLEGWHSPVDSVPVSVSFAFGERRLAMQESLLYHA